MILACILLIAAVAGGVLLTFLYQGHSSIVLRLCLGACTGMVLMATIGFLLSLFLTLTASSIALAAGLLLLPGLLLLRREYRQQIRDELVSGFAPSGLREALPAILLYAGLALVLGLVFGQNMVQRPEGIDTGIDNNLGDLPFHLQVISSFVYGHNIPVEDPSYAGARFTYPILADFLTAMLVRSGASMAAAMWWQNMILVLALIGILHHWTCALTSDRLAAMFAPLLVIFSGGLGWWLLMQDLRASDGGLFTLLGHLPHDYSIMPDSIFRWGNSATTLLVTQRSFLFGVPLALCVLYQWWAVINEPDGKDGVNISAGRRMFAAGICAGLLPLVHSHGFVIIFGAGICLTLLFRPLWRAWLVFLVVAVLVALPEIFWLAHGSAISAKSYLAWQMGWDRANHNAVWFWFVNTGFFIPLLLAAIFWRKYGVSRQVALFYAPFALGFIIPNVLKLSPWIWDNIKFLFYWYVVSAPLVACVLARLWRQSPRRRWVAAGLLLTLTLSGGLDMLRVVTQSSESVEFTQQGMQMGNLINLLVPPRALVLHAPVWNSPVYLTGRRSLLGYSGWPWSRGLEIAQREADINRMYSGGPAAKPLLEKYQVEYVLIGPSERALSFNQTFWESCTKLAQIGEYQLYKPDCAR